MKRWRVGTAIGSCLVVAVALSRGDSGPEAIRGTGPDLIVSDLYEPLYWGPSGDGSIRAYSIGTWACNIGDQPAVWYANTDQHPLIGQNLFRLSGGRFEQLGQSWLKWGYISENLPNCGPCVDPGSSSLLGVNCADSYTATWNGYQPALGPKSVVNPFTGEFPAAPPTPPVTVISGRLQVHTADLADVNAKYYAEGQYVSPDDSAAGNQFNNTSYRQIWVRPDYSLTFISPQNIPSATVPQQPAVAAWAEQDPAVFLTIVDVPGDGRLYVAHRASELGGGVWHHEIAVQNVNSDRAVGGLLVRLPTGATADNPGFHAVAYHSGEIYDSTPWTTTVTDAGVRWDTADFETNPNANALRWGTLYNFWFDTDAPSTGVTLAELRLFKPGTPATVDARIGPIPAQRGDVNCDGRMDANDINSFVLLLIDPGAWQIQHPGCPATNGDLNEDGQADFGDINPFVACLSAGECP